MFKKYLYSTLATMMTLVAVFAVSPRCLLLTYEPEAPACLKKEL